MSAVQYRLGLPEDALCVGVLATQVFLDTYLTEGIREDLAREVLNGYSPDAFLPRLKDANTTFILAESAGYLVGFAELILGRSCPVKSVSSDAEIAFVYVQQNFLRRGIGRELMRAVERKARQRGAASVWLTAWCGNESAQAFYSALGYLRVGGVQHVIERQAYENYVYHRMLDRF